MFYKYVNEGWKINVFCEINDFIVIKKKRVFIFVIYVRCWCKFLLEMY